MQYAPRLTHPSRTFVVPLLAAALGAGVATATFALVNIEDQPTVSLPATQSVAPAADVVAGERADGGPAEGAAQQIMRSSTVDLRGADAKGDFRTSYQPAPAAAATSAPRYDGGPNEGASAGAIGSSPSAAVAPRYDGGPNEGTSAGAIGSSPSEGPAGPEPYSGMRP